MGFHVWGWWSLGCWNRFWAKTWHVSTVSQNKSSSSWIGGGDMLTSAFRNSPVGVHTQVKLICRPSNVMNRTGGCFLQHTSGWIFMKQNPLFVRFFMFDHYLILIIYFSRFSFCSNSILHDFLGGPRIWKGLETMGSNLRTLGTACSSCTAISACGLQEFGLRLSWLPCESLGERFVGWFFHGFLRKILNEERFRSPESSKLQGWYKWLSRKLTCEGVPVTQWSNCCVEKWDAWYVYVVNIYLKIQSFYEDEVGSIDADLRRRCMEAKWVWLDRDR